MNKTRVTALKNKKTFIGMNGKELNKAPIGYCMYYGHVGYVSGGIEAAHQCINKKCAYFRSYKPNDTSFNQDRLRKVATYHKKVKLLYKHDSITKKEYMYLTRLNGDLFAEEFLIKLKSGVIIKKLAELSEVDHKVQDIQKAVENDVIVENANTKNNLFANIVENIKNLLGFRKPLPVRI